MVEKGWEAIFAPDLEAPLRMVLEIGFGRGEFLLDLAARHPETAFVGVEVSFKRCLKLARKLARSGLRNVRLLEGRGEFVVAELMPEASLAEIWVNFSDPWPKGRHARRRLFQSEFVANAARCLVPGGYLRVATDDPAYAEQIAALLAGEPMLENTFAPEPWRPEVSGQLPTGYELEWRAQGRPLHFFAHRRRPI